MSVLDYPVPCDSWLPTLADIEHYKTLPGPIGEYYSRFGFSELAFDGELYPKTSEHLTDLAVRFYQQYAFRMIGQETMERWQIRLQEAFDHALPRFERMYALYDVAKSLTGNDLPGTLRTLNTEDAQSGTDYGHSQGQDESKSIDTPDQAVNASDDYADSLQKGSDSRDTSTTYGRKDAHTGTVRDTLTGASVMDDMNRHADTYRDIDGLFVLEFNKCFLNIYE